MVPVPLFPRKILQGHLAAAISVVICLCHACWAAEDQSGPISLAVPGGGLSVTLSGDGRMVGRGGGERIARPITAETVLAGCQRVGRVEVRKPEGGGVQFTKHLLHASDGRRCLLIERVRPTKRQHSLGD